MRIFCEGKKAFQFSTITSVRLSTTSTSGTKKKGITRRRLLLRRFHLRHRAPTCSCGTKWPSLILEVLVLEILLTDHTHSRGNMRIPRRRLARSEYASERRPVRGGRVVLARFDIAATAPRRTRASVQHVPR